MNKTNCCDCGKETNVCEDCGYTQDSGKENVREHLNTAHLKLQSVGYWVDVFEKAINSNISKSGLLTMLEVLPRIVGDQLTKEEQVELFV